MAIITRWRMPPESWCGYCRAPPRRVGMRTRSSISTARASGGGAATAAVQPQRLGDLLADGEGRVEASHRFLEHHRQLAAAAAAPVRSAPSAGIRARAGASTPPSRAAGGSSPMMASAVTILPQPLSPTMARVLPGRDLEGDAIDRGKAPRSVVEGDGEALDLEDHQDRAAAARAASITARSDTPGWSRPARNRRKVT